MGDNASKFKDLPPGIDPTLREGNPHYGPRMQLFCRNGYHLIIRSDGSVLGDNDDSNPYAIMEFTSAGFGEVKIRGIQANLYLAFNKKGQLYGEIDPFEEATIFRESLLNSWNIYLSKKYEHLNWYVGIKKSGKSKNGQLTKLGQKAIQFLPRRIPNNEDIIPLIE
ncbi:fibroblast growth factor 1-like [Rhodnius prolixus]